jgi:hypothetical protein
LFLNCAVTLKKGDCHPFQTAPAPYSIFFTKHLHSCRNHPDNGGIVSNRQKIFFTVSKKPHPLIESQKPAQKPSFMSDQNKIIRGAGIPALSTTSNAPLGSPNPSKSSLSSRKKK